MHVLTLVYNHTLKLYLYSAKKKFKHECIQFHKQKQHLPFVQPITDKNTAYEAYYMHVTKSTPYTVNKPALGIYNNPWIRLCFLMETCNS